MIKALINIAKLSVLLFLVAILIVIGGLGGLYSSMPWLDHLLQAFTAAVLALMGAQIFFYLTMALYNYKWLEENFLK